jgi:putative transposase
MIVYEFKIKAKESQYRAIDEAIRTSQFIQNKCLRYWMDNKGVGKYDLNKHCAVLAAEFPNSRNTLAQSNIKLAGGSFQRLEKLLLFLIKKVLVL